MIKHIQMLAQKAEIFDSPYLEYKNIFLHLPQKGEIKDADLTKIFNKMIKIDSELEQLYFAFLKR